MNQWLKRLKAAVTLGGLWGAASGAVASACSGVLQLLGGGLAWDLLLQAALQFGLAGFLVGTAFARALLEFELRGFLGRVEGWRMGVWGALMGGVLAPVVLVLGAGSALLGGLGLGLASVVGAAVGSSLSTFTSSVARTTSVELAEAEAARAIASAPADGLSPNDRRS